jgi:formate hydrogenlyase subunit 4
MKTWIDSVPPALLHGFTMVVLPPLLFGVINRVKSWFSGRSGPPLRQSYDDLRRLFGKGVVLSHTSTMVFAAGPIVTVVTTLLAGLFIPFAASAPCSFAGDAVAVLYLLGLGRFFTTAAALDTGSAFEGMGAAREAAFACLTEPVVFFALLALSRLRGGLELSTLLIPGPAAGWSSAPIIALAAAAMFVVLLAEGCRIPFDDPNTHLELTMIHEVMVLDHSGPLLGLVLYGAALKFFLFAAMLVHLFLPVRMSWGWTNGVIFFVGIFAVAVAVGVVESVMARLRLTHIPTLLTGACVLAAFGFLLAWR